MSEWAPNLRLVMIAETLASPILFGLARDGGRFRILGLNPMRRAPRAISQLTMKTFLVPTLREELLSRTEGYEPR